MPGSPADREERARLQLVWHQADRVRQAAAQLHVRAGLVRLMHQRGIIAADECQQLLDMPYESLLEWTITFARARRVTGQPLGWYCLN